MFGGMLIHRNAAAIVFNTYRTVCLDGYLNAAGIPRKGLVDRVIDHLVHQMVQAALSGGTNIHTGAFTYRF